jgi:hypothetical protein
MRYTCLSNEEYLHSISAALGLFGEDCRLCEAGVSQEFCGQSAKLLPCPAGSLARRQGFEIDTSLVCFCLAVDL